jgi:predicted NodU family carbamoyl transferase
MKSAIVRNQANGYSEDDIAAGLAYAIANNYLNKVKENRKVYPKIVFLGGVSNNLAVVAAFKAITGSEVIVPQQADVMGAIGAALIARQEYFKKSGIQRNQIIGKGNNGANGRTQNGDEVLRQNQSSNDEERKLIFLPVNQMSDGSENEGLHESRHISDSEGN